MQSFPAHSTFWLKLSCSYIALHILTKHYLSNPPVKLVDGNIRLVLGIGNLGNDLDSFLRNENQSQRSRIKFVFASLQKVRILGVVLAEFRIGIHEHRDFFPDEVLRAQPRAVEVRTPLRVLNIEFLLFTAVT